MTSPTARPLARAGSARPASATRALIALLLDWQERARSRHRLLQCDRRLLTDMGLELRRAAAKGGYPFRRP